MHAVFVHAQQFTEQLNVLSALVAANSAGLSGCAFGNVFSPEIVKNRVCFSRASSGIDGNKNATAIQRIAVEACVCVAQTHVLEYIKIVAAVVLLAFVGRKQRTDLL